MKKEPAKRAAGKQTAPAPDVVDEASLESFPASDAPAWVGGRRRAATRRSTPVARRRR